MCLRMLPAWSYRDPIVGRKGTAPHTVTISSSQQRPKVQDFETRMMMSVFSLSSTPLYGVHTSAPLLPDNPCHIVGLDCVATGLEVNLIACVHVVSGRCRDPATGRHCNVNDERGLIFRKPREPDFGGEGSNTPR